MTTEQILNFTLLTAADGYKLTQSDDNTELKNRIFASKIALAVNQEASFWKEITEEEAETLKAEQAALTEETEETE